MVQTVETLAVLVILTGFLLFTALETGLIGALLVAGGAYALVLPQFVAPAGPATR